MAKEDEKRKTFWDEEEEALPARKSADALGGPSITSDSTQIDQKLHETQVLLEQTHHLYQHFFNGIEKRAPIEKLKVLELKVNELQRISATSPTSRFKISQFAMHYRTFRDLWERKLRDRERGR